MKVLIVWFALYNPNSESQIDRMVIGFSSLANCGAVQGSISRQFKPRKWKDILNGNNKPTIFYIGCI